MYQLYKEGPEQTLANGVKRVADGTLIPFSDDNRDYQEYQKWLAAGNTPLPADTQE